RSRPARRRWSNLPQRSRVPAPPTQQQADQESHARGHQHRTRRVVANIVADVVGQVAHVTADPGIPSPHLVDSLGVFLLGHRRGLRRLALDVGRELLADDPSALLDLLARLLELVFGVIERLGIHGHTSAWSLYRVSGTSKRYW